MFASISTQAVLITALSTNPMSIIDLDEYKCLVQALYFEARGESLKGQQAVAQVILNRVDSKRFPDTICGVVNQPKQFSYTHDGLSDTIDVKNAIDKKALNAISLVAIDAINDTYKGIVSGANHYYAHNITTPNWALESESIIIGNHTFLKI